jgi:phosphatidylserine/phosphatidylglycerophosphate/cardiolipin synthase-like enzyme
MIVDEGTESDPFVITGSMNWSANGEETNDENTLIIHDAAIANQFYQEFAARYYAAYGIVDFMVP